MRRPALAAMVCAAVLAATAMLAAAAQAAAGGPLPRGFQWGIALSGFQADMGRGRDLDRASDWWAWVRDPRNRAERTVSGDLPEDGPGFFSRYRQDLRLARRGLGMDVFRLSLEWSRLFPRRPQKVPATGRTRPETIRALDRRASRSAVRRYRAILREIRRNGMTPFVTLSHFTLPRWVHDPIAIREGFAERRLGPDDDVPDFARAGWLAEDTVGDFGRFAAWAGATFGDLVDRWAPINEPLVVAASGYANIPGVLDGNFPPGVFSFAGAITAVRNLEAGNTAAYDALKATDRRDADGDGRRATVGLVQNMIGFTPADPVRAADVTGTRRADYLFNRLFLNAAVRGDVDANADGVLQDDERRRHGRKADFVGVNYYFRGRVTGLGSPITPRIPVLDFLPATSYRWALAPEAPACPTTCSDFGSELDPEGLRSALRLAGRYGLPVWVTENGIADADDDRRPRFLRDHLRQMRAAIAAKEADVRGWIGWSLTDNFEWVSGYAPKFGWYRFDPRTLRRTPRRASVRLLRRAATTNRVP